jgi:hypothetical protein
MKRDSGVADAGWTCRRDDSLGAWLSTCEFEFQSDGHMATVKECTFRICICNMGGYESLHVGALKVRATSLDWFNLHSLACWLLLKRHNNNTKQGSCYAQGLSV